MEVYLLGSNDRAAVACIHSFKNFDVNLNIIYGNQDCPSLKSRYLKSKHFISQNQRVEKVLEQIQKTVTVGALLIPINDYYLEFTLRFYAELSKYFDLSFADVESTRCLIDKRALQHVAKSIGINTPDTHLVSTIEDISKIENLGLKFPLIVKPVKSCVIINEYIFNTAVKKIFSMERLRLELLININNCAFLIQEYIPGFGSAVNFYAVDGDIKTAFQYERLHEPGFGGGSSYRKSVPIDNDLLEIIKSLMDRFNFTGLGMIEFRTAHQDGRLFLMEVNARPWGSISLPIFAGVDFPAMVLKSNLGETIEDTDYKVGVYTRNITKDIKWLFVSAFRKRKLRVLLEPLTAARNILLGKEAFDNWAIDDLGPFLKDIENAVREPLRKVEKKVVSYILVRRQDLKRQRISREVASLIKTKKVCFVCRGNIIRSKYAQLYFESITGIVAYSCGTLFSENRKSPFLAVDVAQKRGHNLDSFDSTSIYSFDNLDEFVFLVMDGSNLYDMKIKFGVKNVFLISSAAGHKGVVSDPYVSPFNPSLYNNAFDKIEQYINRIIATL